MPEPTDDRERQLARRERELAAGVARLNAVRSEFHLAAAAVRDRLREAWAAVESQQKRAAAEWAEANRYFTAQAAALDARAAELARREKAAADRHAQTEAEVAGLREEAAALDHRVHNNRVALAELEARRDRAHAELFAPRPPDACSSPAPGSPDLEYRELLLKREKAAVAMLKTALEQRSAELDDRKRLVAEQLYQLADARAQWQRAERETVAEMEELALALRQQEEELRAREQRLIRADVRRREDAYDLWQLRLRLEAWQTKLTAFELRAQTERDRPDGTAAETELAGLRAEVERLAVAVLEIDWPEPPAPPESELPWAIEEVEETSPAVLHFDGTAKAA
jgi:hypothetical protein